MNIAGAILVLVSLIMFVKIETSSVGLFIIALIMFGIGSAFILKGYEKKR